MRTLALHRQLLFLIVAIISLCYAPSLHAQSNELRYELGKRLQRFELAWESANGDARASSTPMMEKAVKSFFALDLISAARNLDEAWLTIQYHPSSIPVAAKYLASLSLRIEDRLVDSASSEVRAQISGLYQGDTPEAVVSEMEAETIAVLEMHRFGFPFKTLSSVTREPLREQRIKLSDALGGFSLNLRDATGNAIDSGDYSIELKLSGKPVSMIGIGNQLSIDNDLDVKINAIESWLAEQKTVSKANKKLHSTRTASFLAKGIADAKQKKVFECDVPLTQWLLDFSKLTDQSQTRKEEDSLGGVLNATSFGNHWIALAGQRGEQIIRVDVPKRPPPGKTDLPSTQQIPVVFAFHGAGGSENMFFETYGAGKLIALARERGWLVVSPRQGLIGLSMNIEQMLDSLSAYLPIDRQRVYVVGHSMGAGTAMAQVQQCPDGLQAVAAIGGGGRVPTVEGAKSIRFFVAAGSRDFGRSQATSLEKGLQKQNFNSLFREYEGIEHMVIIQAALEDVFNFFDTKTDGT